MLQYATADIGAILVTINPAFRRHELGYVLAQSGAGCWSRPRVKGVATRAMVAPSPGLPRPRTRHHDR